MSEDESLQHIIRDAEESSRHLSRSDSRYGSLKRGQRQESNSEDDLHSENLETMELRASYEDCLQEVHTLEALLFQVDCLQDALESTEEMLAETQRDNHSLTMELERERAMRRTSEDIIASLKRELERSREERTREQRQWMEGTSVDWDEQPLAHTAEDLNTSPFLSLKHEAQGAEDTDESSGYEDAPCELSPSPSTPDTQPDTEEEGDRTSDSKNTDSCALS
ncbi:leucine-rich repeat flightless-interacting protein 2-like [Carassius carassius]|uniref:leucine-rich repeat flightless-interacting protein 2-like n=1 Tax=Carassius carassius TaxID=217509 RepID=UPI0028687D3C|nr:leucine-rich repeat flightless-interacting protein 2-like [Carassius carassius]